MNQLLLKPYKKGLHYYFKVRTWYPFWFNILNKSASDKFKNNLPDLNLEQKKVIDEINKNGIAVTTLEVLFPGESMLEKLRAYAESLNPEEAQQGKKSYLKKYWDREPVLDGTNPFLTLSLSPTIHSIVNSYMQMWTKLKYYDLALTIPVGENSDAVQSQRWHRDPEEKKMCKVFIYLNDVDETSGPFTYIPATQYGGTWGHLFPQYTPEGIYPDEKDIFSKIPKENTRTMTGNAGTVIFCDTSGLHRGGYATHKERLMYTAFFSAPSYSDKPSYSYGDTVEMFKTSLTPEARFAIEK